ncbi:MAG: metallophosphoesterase [Candidatus Eisenbacteria bacterium]|nr:metallophosphoesterase [Candidatus Eisenbacteria bacterium]
MGGPCYARIVSGPGEVIADPVMSAGGRKLIHVPETSVPTFWLPCDSLEGSVELLASWHSLDGRPHEARKLLTIRNVELRLRVQVLPELPPECTLYAAGSLQALGRLPDGTWQPRAFPMTPLGSGHWFGMTTAGPGDRCTVEFTLGGWGTKGRNASGSVVKVSSPLVANTGCAVLVDNFGRRRGSPGAITEHLSVGGAEGDRLVLAFRDEGEPREVRIGPSPEKLSPRRLRRDEGGAYVELADVRPGEQRWYRLDPGGEPRVISIPDEREITFCVLGDIQGHAGVVEAMMSRENPHLVLHAGDLVNAGWVEEDWTLNMEIIRAAAARVPYMAVPGNHEEQSPIFGEVFHFPQAEYYYAFAFGPARFLMLDSEAPYEPGTVQRAFAESVLTAWATFEGPVFAVLHAPPYSTGRHGSDFAARRELCPLLERAGVSVVFSGHDHGYEATVPLRGGVPRDDGTVYVVAAGGGARLYETKLEPPAWSRGRHVTHHWLRVRATRERVEVSCIAPDGTPVDSFTVTPHRR